MKCDGCLWGGGGGDGYRLVGLDSDGCESLRPSNLRLDARLQIELLLGRSVHGQPVDVARAVLRVDLGQLPLRLPRHCLRNHTWMARLSRRRHRGCRGRRASRGNVRRRRRRQRSCRGRRASRHDVRHDAVVGHGLGGGGGELLRRHHTHAGRIVRLRVLVGPRRLRVCAACSGRHQELSESRVSRRFRDAAPLESRV